MITKRQFLSLVFVFSCLPLVLRAETIRGMLVDNGAPASNVKIAAIDSQKKQRPATYTNKEGLFYLRGIARSDVYALRVWVDDEKSIELPVVASVKPSTDLPPIDITASVESKGEQVINATDIDKFLRNYYQLYEKGDVDSLAQMYGDFVDYYEKGTKDRSFVVADKRDFVKYITKRKFTVKSFNVFDTLVPSEKGVRFTFSFLVGPLQQRMTKPSNSTEVWTLRRTKGKIQIIRCRSDRMG